MDQGGKAGDRGGFHVGEDGGGHVGERAGSEVFEDEGVPLAAIAGELLGEGGGDGLGGAVGDEGDFFCGVDAQAGDDGGAGAGDEVGGVRQGEKSCRCFGHGGAFQDEDSAVARMNLFGSFEGIEEFMEMPSAVGRTGLGSLWGWSCAGLAVQADALLRQ